MVEIRKDYILNLLEKFKKTKDILIKPEVKRCGRFKKLNIPDGQIIYTTLWNTQGWWSIACMYEDAKRVEIYDMHVFERYQGRYLKKKIYNRENLISEFLSRNSEGTIYLESGNKFSKRVKDGACLGDISEDFMIIYNKTFISENLIDPKWQRNLC